MAEQPNVVVDVADTTRADDAYDADTASPLAALGTLGSSHGRRRPF